MEEAREEFCLCLPSTSSTHFRGFLETCLASNGQGGNDELSDVHKLLATHGWQPPVLNDGKHLQKLANLSQTENGEVFRNYLDTPQISVNRSKASKENGVHKQEAQYDLMKVEMESDEDDEDDMMEEEEDPSWELNANTSKKTKFMYNSELDEEMDDENDDDYTGSEVKPTVKKKRKHRSVSENPIWGYFDQDSQDVRTALCKICSVEVTRSRVKSLASSGRLSIVALKEHLKLEHPVEMDILLGGDGEEGSVKKRRTEDQHPLWEHFVKDIQDSGIVSCRHCPVQINRKRAGSGHGRMKLAPLKEHLKKHHPDVEWNDDKNQFGQKKRRQFLPNSVLCPVCGQEFKKKEKGGYYGYDVHMMHHKTEAFSCDCPGAPKLLAINPLVDEAKDEETCNKEWLNKGNHSFRKRGFNFYEVERHMKIVHMGWVACTECQDVYDKQEKLDTHMLHHFQTYVCDKCGFETDVKSKLANHTKTHHDHQEVNCEQCGKAYKNVQRLREHINKVHRSETCKICNKTVKKLSLHISEVHTRDCDKKVQCSECGKGFNDNSRLNAHMMNVHIKSRPFTCRYFSLKFSISIYLQKVRL